MLPCSEQEREVTQGNPTKGQKGADPRNGGRRPKERHLQVGYAVPFKTLSGSSCGRRPAVVAADFAYGQSEVALGWYFLISRPAVSSLLPLSTPCSRQSWTRLIT